MRILLIGYGKMGKTIERLAIQKGHEISGAIDKDNFDELDKLLPDTDVAIEFSNPDSAPSNIMKCIQSGTPVVCGTTGWLKDMDRVQKSVSENHGAFFYASNYSVGVNIFFALNKKLAKMMNSYPEYNITIDETHHTEKLDAPSGTAITLAEGIYNDHPIKEGWILEDHAVEDKVNIISHRIGEVYGKHTITYDSPIDQIKITHDAHTRDGFAIGAILAAEWIIGKEGVFGMPDLLGI